MDYYWLAVLAGMIILGLLRGQINKLFGVNAPYFHFFVLLIVLLIAMGLYLFKQ
ncbi:MAG: hypothetical protein ACW99Q_14595 [Candidatus Kariarchaeaceae archaeon]|jgi:hypothetical protein